MHTTRTGPAPGDTQEPGPRPGPGDLADPHADSRYLTALDSMADAFVLTSTVRGPDGTVTDFEVDLANAAACRLFGLGRDELHGQRMRALSARHPYLGVASLCRHSLDSGKPLVTEIVGYTAGSRGGEPAAHSLRVAPTGDGVSLTWYDITERRRAERTLAEANAEVSDHAHRMEATIAALQRSNTALERTGRLLDLVFSSSSGMLAVTDYDGRTVRVNPAWTAALGWSEEDLRSRPIHELVHPDDLDTTMAAFERLQSTEHTALRFENRCRTRDGGYRWLQWDSVTLPDEQLVVANARDFTEEREHTADLENRAVGLARSNEDLERLNTELAASNEDLETFAYVCSHDLSEPLRIINGFVTLFVETQGDTVDERGREYLDFIVDGTVRMRQLIEDLLVYSRIGRVDAEAEQVDLDALTRRVAAEQEQVNPGVDVSIEIRDELPAVAASPTEMEQLFTNVLGNAVKFRSPDRPCQVAVYARQASPGWVEIRVDDNGIGVPYAQRERIFKMFQRLHTRDAYLGTGIGLAVCRKIIERIGGRVWVEDSDLGGLSFGMTLPLASTTDSGPAGQGTRA